MKKEEQRIEDLITYLKEANNHTYKYLMEKFNLNFEQIKNCINKHFQSVKR